MAHCAAGPSTLRNGKPDAGPVPGLFLGNPEKRQFYRGDGGLFCRPVSSAGRLDGPEGPVRATVGQAGIQRRLPLRRYPYRQGGRTGQASGGKEFGRCEAVWRSGSRPGAFGVDPLGGRGLEGQAAAGCAQLRSGCVYPKRGGENGPAHGGSAGSLDRTRGGTHLLPDRPPLDDPRGVLRSQCAVGRLGEGAIKGN